MTVRLGPHALLLVLLLSIGLSISCATPAEPSPTPTLPSDPASPVAASPSPRPEPPPTTTAAASTQTPLSDTPTPISAPTTPAATPTPAADVRYGGTLNLVTRHDVVHLDVHQDVSPALSTWGPGIAYSRLMRFETGPDVELPSLAVECELCERWETEDGRTYVFHLRRGVLWHDIPPVNGRELTAADIVFSYARQRQETFPNAALLRGVRRIEALDPYTLRIELDFPNVDFPIALADGHSKIVAREAVELSGDLMNGPTIGTGPWILTQIRPGTSYSFTANPSYFEEGLPLVDSLNVKVISDTPTRDAAFRVNRIDVHQPELDEWEALRERRPDMLFAMVKESGVGLEVALKTAAPPFDDVLVRRAVFAAIDPWRSIDDIWRGAAYVSGGFPMASADWLLNDEEHRSFFAQPGLARDLLDQARVALPVPVTITVGDFGERYLDHARRIADEMEDVGFKVEIEVVNRKVFGEDVWLGGEYQMMVGPSAPVTTPNDYLVSVLHSQGPWNTTEHADAHLDGLILAQAGELDPSIRAELVRDIQRQMLINAYRYMPATRVSIWSWWPKVRNFHPNFAGFEYAHWSRVWLSE